MLNLTREEFANTCQCTGAEWVCIDDKVYDVSDWARSHPGGYDLLASMTGLDVSEVFHAFHILHGSSARAVKVLEHLPHVANVTHAEAPESELQKAFHVLRASIEREGLYQTDYFYYYRMGAWLLFLYLLGVYLTLAATTALSTTLAGFCMGLFFQQCAFVGHDAGHCSITHDRKTDALIGAFVGPLLTGVSIDWWKSTHNAHHVATNSISHDPDIQHMPVLAISREQLVGGGVFSSYHQRYLRFDSVAKALISYQQYLFLPLMAVARWNLYLQSLVFVTDLGCMAVFWLWFSCLVSCLPLWRLRFLFLLASHAFAGILHLQIVLSHFSMPVYAGRSFDAPPGEEFFRQQCHTCMDIYSNWTNDWFYGGLQHQLAHHLFPRLPRNRLGEVQLRVQHLCNEFRVPYKIVGWWEGVVQVLQTLGAVATLARETRTIR
jgi:fatty acid desaturase/predicted heme/steroid binding protein